jgi:methionyl-tRNA formyltransferase
MKFKKIDHIILFGGSRILADLALWIKRSGEYALTIFSCERQLNEGIFSDGSTLRRYLEENDISYYSTEDINQDENIDSLIKDTSLGIGLGEAWGFSKKLIDKLDGRLLDLMGIRLPQYRGGAHYTWQILRQNRIGCCNLQIINEEMVQGEFDSGEIVKTREYFFPTSARIPEDYFNAATQEEIRFLKEFLEDIKNGQEFQRTRLQENFSIYFPRLYTKKHAYINWNWDTSHIESFVCAFDDPYPGAMTFVNGEKVHLKKCFVEYNDGNFHPFQSGLIYKIDEKAIYVATASGTLVVKEVINENNENIISKLKTGFRFFTPQSIIEEAMQYHASYDAKGIR